MIGNRKALRSGQIKVIARHPDLRETEQKKTMMIISMKAKERFRRAKHPRLLMTTRSI